jgi:hypothetical protein
MSGTTYVQTISTNSGNLNLSPVGLTNTANSLQFSPTTTTGSTIEIRPLNFNITGVDEGSPATLLSYTIPTGPTGSVVAIKVSYVAFIQTTGDGNRVYTAKQYVIGKNNGGTRSIFFPIANTVCSESTAFSVPSVDIILSSNDIVFQWGPTFTTDVTKICAKYTITTQIV